MKAKNVRYIKKAEEFYLYQVSKGWHPNLDRLWSYLDIDVIPCCSMSNDDQNELRLGLADMIDKYESEPKLF